jgi:peptidyl-prolyl cis-trans isomerase A (cyclophilin A)
VRRAATRLPRRTVLAVGVSGWLGSGAHAQGSAAGGASAAAGTADAATVAAPVRVLLDTALGGIVVAVDLAHAPLSGADFLRYVDQGFYKKGSAAFYRAVRRDNDHGSPAIEVIQGGLQDGAKGLPPVAHESTTMTGLKHLDGSLSLARGAPGTGGGAAFFICIGPQPGLDAGAKRNPDGLGFAVFGRVEQGMDVVRRIHQARTDPEKGEDYVKDQLLVKPAAILSARRL